MTSDMTNKARSVSHTGHNTDGPLSVLRRASGKDSLFLLTWMSPQRRRRFRKLSSRIRKSFRAAKRWKSSFRVRRRSSTFRVSSMLPNILLCDGVSAELLLFSVFRVASEALKTCVFKVLFLSKAYYFVARCKFKNGRTHEKCRSWSWNPASGTIICRREFLNCKSLDLVFSCFLWKKFSSALLWSVSVIYMFKDTNISGPGNTWNYNSLGTLRDAVGKFIRFSF